ncbi:MAG TPA: EAL domain-containing protein [Xanthobacteraceae bacterium]
MLQWARSFAQTTTFLGAMMIAAIWTGVFLLSSSAHDRAYEDGLRRGRNLAHIFEEYISRIIRSTDSQLLVLRKLYQQEPANFDFARWIDSTSMLSNLTVHFAITGRDGFIKLSSRGPLRSPVDVSRNSTFKVHVNSTTDQLYIGEPRFGRVSGRTVVQLTRRLTAPDGSFAGTIGGSLDILQLEKFYNAVDIGRASIITLVGFDGIIRARSGREPAASDFIGHSVGHSKLFELLGKSPNGSYWNTPGTAQQFEGVSRLMSYRVVDGLPLVAMVGLAESDVFEEALSSARKYEQIGFLLTAIVLIAMGIGAMRKRKLNATTAALERSKASLEQTNLRFDTALDHMPHGLCMFDREKRLLVSNRRYSELYGLTSDKTRPGTTLRAILEARVAAGSAPADVEGYIDTRLAEVSRSEPLYVVNELRDGRFFAVTHQPMLDGGWVAIHQEITAQKKAESQIAYMARHDGLTGLANRAVLRERMQESLDRVRQGRAAFSIFMLDLDLFKAVNDSLGHPIGDELLKVVAQRLSACLGENDTVARLGGDEFAILATAHGDQRETAVALANRLLEAVAAPYDIDGNKLDIATSIGIAFAPEHGMDVDQLVKSADLALYKAKSEGRNAYRLFEAAMGAEAHSRRALEIDLRDALAQGELALHYHPIVDIRSKEIASVEALVRWNHPQRGMIAPGDFIPVAEETGLIHALGEWVLRRACTDAAAWPSRVRVAVNLSPVQFRRSNLIDVISQALADSGLAAERLKLEITESVLMQGNAENIDTLHRLRGLGVSIVLDDFGTGYSSLSYLRMFPFDQIKIDRSFVSELSSNADCSAIVSAVAGLGRSLKVATVAEGVETEEQLLLVRAAGCTHAQGFLFGRPCPAAQLDLASVSPEVRKGEAA